MTRLHSPATSVIDSKSFKWIADAIPVLACYVDRSLHYCFMNARYRAMFGLDKRADITLLTMREVLGDDAFRHASVNVDRVLTGELVTYELELDVQHQHKVIQVHYIPDYEDQRVPDAGVCGFFMMGLDVTELRSTQENYKNDLIEQVELKTRHLSEALRELGEAQNLLVEKEKMASLGALLAGVSHGLNTPIGICITALTKLEELSGTIETRLLGGNLSKGELEVFLEDNGELLQLAIDNARRSSDLIDSFRNLGMRDDQDHKQTIRLIELVRHTTSALYYKRAGKALKYVLNIEEDLNVCLQPEPLEKVISSFISNSISHGFTGNREYTITITARLSDGELVITYEDDGEGLSEDARKHILEPFYTSDMGRFSGLGMTDAYNIVSTLLSGQMDVSRELDSGMHIVVRIPHQPRSPLD